MAKQKEYSLKYKLQEIKTIKFVLEKPNKEKYHKYSLVFEIGLKIEQDNEIIFVLLGVSVYDNEQHEYKLSEIAAEFIYRTNGLKKVESEGNEIKLPNKFLLTLLSISYSTLRGIIHEKCANTYLNDLIIPIIDPKDLLPKKRKL